MRNLRMRRMSGTRDEVTQDEECMSGTRDQVSQDEECMSGTRDEVSQDEECMSGTRDQVSQDEECMSGTRDEATKLLELYYKHFDLLKVTTVERLFIPWIPLSREFTVLV